MRSLRSSDSHSGQVVLQGIVLISVAALLGVTALALRVWAILPD